MKKTLVITLALVMAFASSAMAAVNFGGSFEAIVENDSFTEANFKLQPELKLNVKAASSGDDWSFEAEVGSLLTAKDEVDLSLGKYLLELNDNYFDLSFWGKGRNLKDKATALGFLKSAKKETAHRARLFVPVMDLAELTVDFKPGTLYAFADLDIAGYEAGLGYKRASSTDTIVGWGKAGLDLADTAVNLEGTVGMTLVETPDDPEADKPSGLAYGAKASADVIEDLNVWAQFIGAGDGWAGDNAKKLAGNNIVSFGADYEVTDLQVGGSFEQVLGGKNSLDLGAKYRFSDKLAYNRLFHKDHWFKNDAPAVGVSSEFEDFKFDNVRVDVASPVLEGMIWAKAFGKYYMTTATDEAGEEIREGAFEVGADAHIVATEKLTVKPAVGYKSEGKIIDVKADADYKIGTSDTKLGLTVQKIFAEAEADEKELIKASVKVTF